MLAAVVFGAFTILGVLAAAFYGIKNREAVRASEDAASAWRRERDAEALHVARLEESLSAAQEQIRVLEGRVEELSRRPDLRALERALERHEKRAQERADLMATTLAAIAKTLIEGSA